MIDLTVPQRPSCPERAESRPCKVCGEAIQPGQIYLPDGRQHIYCFAPAESRRWTALGRA
jgi:hypothetical protein